MLCKVFSIQIKTTDDMGRLEEALVRLVGGERSKCALVRSQDFVNLRLRALYDRGPSDRIVVYGERIKVCLESDKTAEIYLIELGIDGVPALLGKRGCPEEEPDGEDPGAGYAQDE